MGTSDSGDEFDLTPPRRTLSLLDSAREQLSPFIDQAAIGRIVQAAEEIAVSRDRILAEHMVIGSRLADIHQILITAIRKRNDNLHQVSNQASTLLYEFARHTLQIGRGTAKKYLSVYLRFVNNADAITFLNLGELSILKRHDITTNEVALIVDAKREGQRFSRDEMIPFIERYRAAAEEIDTLEAQLESAQEELTAGLAAKTELELEIKYLREQATTAGSKESQQRESINKIQAALASQSSTVESLQMAVQRSESERASLQQRLADMKVREVIKEVTVEVLPAGLASVAEALAETSARLEKTQAELADSEARLASVNTELLEREETTDDKRRLEIRVAGLKADLEDIVAKFRSSKTIGDLRNHRGTLTGLKETLMNFYNELSTVTEARP